MAGIGSTMNPDIRRLRELAVFTEADVKKMLTALDKEFRKNEKRQFATEGATGGERWQALSPKYAAVKKRMRRRGAIVRGQKVTGTKIMQLTGEGRKSLTQKGGKHIAGAQRNKTRVRMFIGTRAIHLAYHINPSLAVVKFNPLYNKRMPHRDTLQMTRTQELSYIAAVEKVVVAKRARIAKGIGAIRRSQARRR